MNGMGFICIAFINERMDIYVARAQVKQEGKGLLQGKEGRKWHKH
jgi:hypothetical protein